MALVFVAKGMQVANPVGQVNIHPLPALPSGLSRLHLLRRSLAQVNMNLADGSEAGFAETHVRSDDGTLTYSDDSIHSDWGSTGWYDPEWSFPYDGGVTWMAVADLRDDGESVWLMSSGDYWQGGVTVGTLNMTFRTSNLRWRIGGTGMSYAEAELSSVPSQPVMGFGTTKGSDETRSVFVPHAGVFSDISFDHNGHTPDSDGVGIVALPTNTTDTAADTRMYMVAQWDRVLSQSEMTDAYTALKPWLLARGVEIA